MKIEAKNLTKKFEMKSHSVIAVNDLSFKIDAGEFVAIHGASGCGKSTLLLMLGTLLKPDSGEITINGINPYLLNGSKRTKFRADNLGFIFQEFYLIPYLNILSNIMLPSVAKKVDNAEQLAVKLAEKFNLSNRISHIPSMLSVGEQQRVAMARALFLSPGILLADEPTGNLDNENTNIILQYFRSFVSDGGIVVMVTHDDSALKYTDRVIELKAH